MPFAISEEKDISSDLFGLLQKWSRADLDLRGHISAYTATDLTFPSDALNAMRGLFAFYSNADPPVKQFWGIPTRGYDIEDSHLLPSSSFLSISLACGLSWTTPYGALTERRYGFPSWSWAGWKAHVMWLHNYETFETHANVLVRISAVKQDGSSAAFTTELIDEVFLSGQSRFAYTYLLRIEAEIVRLRFENVSGFQGASFGRDASSAISKFAVIGSTKDGGPTYGWLFYPTPPPRTVIALHQELCEEVFDCIILTRMHGLVVRESNGVTERLGLIVLRGVQIPDKSALWYDEDKEAKGPHIREAFPTEVREIVLG
jgi:hypothetical protein